MKFMRITDTKLILRRTNNATIERLLKKSLKALGNIDSLIRIVNTDIKSKNPRFPDEPIKSYLKSLNDIKKSFNGRKLTSSYRLLNIVENTDRIDEYFNDRIEKITAEKQSNKHSKVLLKKLLNNLD